MAGTVGFHPDSLLKYDPPRPIKKTKNTQVAKISRDPLYRDIESGDEVLDIVLPPREFVGDDGTYYVQKVSRTPATSRDIEKLREELDRKLLERGARISGPCTIRRGLYMQVLDELIRQETIACAETGILLAAWRNNCVRNIKAYENLFVSRLVRESEKFLELEQRKLDMKTRVQEKQRAAEDLERKVCRARAKLQHARLAREERASLEQQKNSREIEELSLIAEEGLKKMKIRLKEMKGGM